MLAWTEQTPPVRRHDGCTPGRGPSEQLPPARPLFATLITAIRMLAVISSTLFPPPMPTIWGSRQRLDSGHRLAQTRETIRSLLGCGATEIIVADNSGSRWTTGTERALEPARVVRAEPRLSSNYGISELYLLLAIVGSLPRDKPLVKVSGRYTVSRNILTELGDAEFVIRWVDRPGPRWMSTRYYGVRDAVIYEAFLRRALRECFAYRSRVVGPRSLLRIVLDSLHPERDQYPYEDPPLPIEQAAARVLHAHRYRVRVLDHIGVRGSSTFDPEKVIEE